MISELEANEKIARIKPVHLQRKDGAWSMPIFNGIQLRGGQESASGLPGDCKSLKCSSSVQHRSFLLCERAKCGSSACFLAGQAAPWVRTVAGLGSSRPSDAERFGDGSRVSDIEVFEDEVLAGGGRVSTRRLVHGK